MGMLTREDLKQIGDVVDQKLDEKLEPVLEAVREGFELLEAKMATKDDLAALGNELRGEMSEMRHELMDHTDRTVTKAVGELRSELREHNVIA